MPNVIPNFLIIGAQKSGTTSLHDLLSQHPNIGMSKVKETNFFLVDELYSRGPEYYASFFGDLSEYKWVGESTPSYLNNEKARHRIHSFNPDLKLILILRDPIERAYSQYWDNRRRLFESRTFEECVDQYCENPEKFDKGYFNRGFYSNQISAYLELFPRKNIHVTFLETLKGHPKATLNSICNFLEVEELSSWEVMKSNTSKIYSNLLYKLAFYNPEILMFVPLKLRPLFYLGKKIPFEPPQMAHNVRKKLYSLYEQTNRDLSMLFGEQVPF